MRQLPARANVSARNLNERSGENFLCAGNKRSPRAAGPWAAADNDFDILIKRCKEPHQALDGEAFQPIFGKSRNRGLIDSQQLA